MKISFLKTDIRDSDIRNMVKCIKSDWLVHGPHTDTFEKELAEYLGVKGAVMVGSATAALHLSLVLAGVGEGDEVITTPISWVATSNVILYQNATPVFVDVEADTGLIDVSKIEAKITKKTKAIVVVHLYGQMADMKALDAISRKYKIPVIEDTAHALEASREGIRPGSLGFSACLSFHVAKNITAGQGGAYITNNHEHVEQIKLLRRDGVRNEDGVRIMYELGYKYDATDYQAALLVGQLGRIKSTHKRRLAILNKYHKELKGIVSYPLIKKDAVHAAHMTVVWVDPAHRDVIREFLKEKGIQTSDHYRPIHLEPYYRKRFGYKEGDFPIAEKLGKSTIVLPTYYRLTDKEQTYIINNVKVALKKYGA